MSDYYSFRPTPPPKLFTRVACFPIHGSSDAPLTETWISEMRSIPELSFFPAELILALGSWCLDPRTLLNLSSTCTKFARILRTVDCWLDHHWGRGYDIGVLRRKANRAAVTSEQKYGPEGWGLLVKSAFDKAEFPDDLNTTQWNMGKPLPHVMTMTALNGGFGIADAYDRYRARGVQYMEVMYDILTEHECHNLELYPYLHDEALYVRVKDPKSRYMQALISASYMLIMLWAVPIAVMPGNGQIFHCQASINELQIDRENYQKSSYRSLAYSFLCALKLLQMDPDSQTERKLFPHPPMGPDMWHDDNGDIPPNGLGWISRAKASWKGTVYVIGQFGKITSLERTKRCPFARLRINRTPMRMCLEFLPNGEIEGRGGDYGGKFVITGTYKSTYVKLQKEYIEDDPDMYMAEGHMLPWGIYGHWSQPDEPEYILGYWCMWHYEGAPIFPLTVPYKFGDIKVYPKHPPYKVDPEWFERYERERELGEHYERHHGWWMDPPPQPEQVALPALDAWGF